MLRASGRAAYIRKFINLHKSVKRLVYQVVSVYNLRMVDEMKTERITTMMTPSEVQVIDDWAFANRIRSRGEAIRRLIEAGLSKTAAPPDGGNPGSSRKSDAREDPSLASRLKKPAAPARKAEPAASRSKLDQIRALRERGGSFGQRNPDKRNPRL